MNMFTYNWTGESAIKFRVPSIDESVAKTIKPIMRRMVGKVKNFAGIGMAKVVGTKGIYLKVRVRRKNCKNFTGKKHLVRIEDIITRPKP